MRLDSFTKNSIYMFASSSVGAFFNLAYQWFILRAVSPEEFAAFNSLLSLLLIFLFPVTSFTIMVTRHVSSSNARKEKDYLKGSWQVLARHALIFSTCIFLLIASFSGYLAHFLHIKSQASTVILGAIIFSSGIAAVISGGLQGLERFKLIAVISVIAGFLKLISPLALFRLFPRLEGALLGFLVAIIAGVILSLKAAWPLLKEKVRVEIKIKEQYLFILPVAAVSLFSLLLTNLDMVLVKHLFFKEAQDYAVAQMLGKIVLFLPGFIYMVMFSRACSLHAQKSSSLQILKRTLMITFALGAGVCAVYNLFPEFIFGLLARRYNPQIIALGRFFSLNMFIFSLCNVLFYYQLSVENYRFLLPSLLVTLLIFLLIWLWPLNIFWVAGLLTVAFFVILAINLSTTMRTNCL